MAGDRATAFKLLLGEPASFMGMGVEEDGIVEPTAASILRPHTCWAATSRAADDEIDQGLYRTIGDRTLLPGMGDEE